MDANGAPTLSDVSGSQLVLACTKCDRRGVYNLDRLIGRHGDVTLTWLREHLAADCPRRLERRHGDWCGAVFEGL